jgi:hypothetical protein
MPAPPNRMNPSGAARTNSRPVLSGDARRERMPLAARECNIAPSVTRQS